MNFIFECIKRINNNKATVLDPGRFMDKKEALDIREKKNQISDPALIGHSEEMLNEIAKREEEKLKAEK